ncbi:MAG: threonine synthase [Proteobacteria bacterium]|nr:threonine synthase [Pseudomonadota bacterium]
MSYTILCTRCGKEIASEGYAYLCPGCGGILEIEYDMPSLREELPAGWPMLGKGMETYKGLLPIGPDSSWVSLGEGSTPLVPSVVDGECEVFFKNEGANPTGSFKDRPISLVVTKARGIGAEVLITSSSGNAGVSLAAYAARANLEAYVLVAESTPPGKLKQIGAHGAKIFRVKGDVSRAFEIALAVSNELGYVNAATTFLSPYPTEGDKTVAYEIFSQLERDVPDWIFIPIGAGPLLAGCYKGFEELVQLRIAGKMPRLVGVQAEGCSPIALAFRKGASRVLPWCNEVKTVATGIADPLTGYPQDGEYVLKLITLTKGLAISVTDGEIFSATKQLAEREGIWAEPTGAVGLAGFWELLRRGVVQPGEKVVILVTGHGMKDPVITSAEYPLVEDLRSLLKMIERG